MAAFGFRVNHFTVSINHLKNFNSIHEVNQFLKDRIESFDDYYPCIKEECNLIHVNNWIQLFVSMYNDTIANKSNFELNKEVNIILS